MRSTGNKSRQRSRHVGEVVPNNRTCWGNAFRRPTIRSRLRHFDLRPAVTRHGDEIDMSAPYMSAAPSASIAQRAWRVCPLRSTRWAVTASVNG